ncbi:hypothetical protein ACIBHY_34680 [Nonomuraea sp. NPDC050547]|uniref:hypothetical protein n=1 Tax=unclassified Nonomuraea TaxID=2593643 RepID=UPI0037881AF1
MSGLLVGAVFGAVFVVVNAQEPLDGAVAAVLRVLAGLAAASVVAMWFVAVRRERPVRERGPRPGMFGKGYLVVVAAEAVLLFCGLRVLAAWGVPAQANVAWVAFVVGVHFVALAPIWKDWAIAVPGAVLTVLGVAGLVMAATAGLAWVPFVSGVLSGAVLLAGSVTFGWKAIRSVPAGVPVRA